jgi:hypothetical protein
MLRAITLDAKISQFIHGLSQDLDIAMQMQSLLLRLKDSFVVNSLWD